MANEIELVNVGQSVKIIDNIEALSKQVQQEIDDLNIDSLEATEENKQKLKNTRASLNTKLTQFETDRKAIKNLILKPFEEFETVYEEKLKSIIQKAVKDLDTKVKNIEIEQVDRLKKYGIKYFAMKMEATPIKHANTFDDVDVKITVTTKEKKIRDEIDRHFEKISSALTIIEANENKARLIVLWEKNSYDIGVALVKLSEQLAQEKKYEEPVKIQYQTMDPIVVPVKIITPEVTFTPEELYDFKLKITLTEKQLANLTSFMESQNITFELDESDE